MSNPQQINEDLIKQGFLLKEGRFVKSWRKRYFVLKQGCLFYYETSTSLTPIGVVPLFNCKCEFTKKATLSADFYTLAIHTRDRKLYVQSKHIADLKEWGTLIQKSGIVETAHKGLTLKEQVELSDEEISDVSPDNEYYIVRRV